jgi:ubiquitin carboxyl-terminal hydrolase 48
LLVVQHDVTERVQLEAELAEVTDAQLGMLSEIFPRYVIEQLGTTGQMDVPNLAQTARRHSNATLLFMGVW